MLFVEQLQAARIHHEWEPSSGVEEYEYEISEKADFSPDALVRQGRVKEPHFEGDFRPGVYYFRMRLIESNGRAGKWSTVERSVLEAQPTHLKLPSEGEEIEILGASTPISFQWESVEGATDYQLLLQSKTHKTKSYVSPSPSLSVHDLGTGKWEAQVISRVNGEAFSKSPKVSFSLRQRSLPRPRILQPLDGDLLTAYEMTRVRWTRSIPGSRSEVDIARVDSDRTKVISRDPVSGTAETRTPPLAPGRYQVTIRDFVEDSQESTDQTVTIIVEEDPMGYHSQYLGATFRLLSGEIQFGSNEMKNPFYYDSARPILSHAYLSRSKLAAGGLEMRLSTRIHSPWGMELLAGLDVMRFFLRPPDDLRGEKEIAKYITPFRFKLGPTYRWEPWGPTKPIFLKGLLFAREFRQLSLYKLPALNSSPTQDRGYALQQHYAQIWGLTAGAELRYGGWNARWDATTELQLDFPLMSFGSSLGSGSPRPLPTFDWNALLRVKVTDEMRLLGGFFWKWGHLTASNGSRADGNSQLNYHLYGLKGGVDIDL